MSRDRRPSPVVELSTLLDRQPPQSLTSEFALLGALLLDPGRIGEASAILGSPDDFVNPAHAAIYEATLALFDRAGGVDASLLVQAMTDAETLEAAGGMDYILELVNGCAEPHTATQHARVVADKATRRRLIEACGVTVHAAYGDDLTTDELLDRSEADILAVRRQGDDGDADGADIVRQTFADIVSGAYQSRGIDTGLHEFDEATGGLQPGQLIVAAGRPSMGKTSWALSILVDLAVSRKVPCGLISLEMSTRELGARLIANRARVPFTDLTKNRLAATPFHNAESAAEELSRSVMRLDDRDMNRSVVRARASARRMVAEHGVQVLFIDYLQLMGAPGKDRDGRQNEVAVVSAGLKGLAKELGVPVVALAQINRANTQREDKRPRMSDLRESGSIENDADVILMLHREEYYHRSDSMDDREWRSANPEMGGVGELIIEKQRNGPTCTIKLAWDGPSMRYSSLATAPQQQSFAEGLS